VIDEALLNSHRRHEDHGLGISEEFLQPLIGGWPTVGVLSRPLRDPLPFGWVVCHSLGLEQIHLGRLEVIAARQLSVAGFWVLRYHGRGYGDSEGDPDGISLSSHLACAADAVELMRGVDGVEKVGAMGARFGGAVATLAADQLALSGLVLWDPVIKGAQYMRDFLRTRLFSDMVIKAEAGGASDMNEIRQELSIQGWADIKGFRLTSQAHDEISGLDLTTDVARYEGPSLVVGLSRTGEPSQQLTRFVGHLRALGGDCTLETVQDPLAAQFGQFRFQTIEGGRGKRDSQLEMGEQIAAVTARWARSQVMAAHGMSKASP
jgi:pimeloyl-ACP methyl ester carboxylesterase